MPENKDPIDLFAQYPTVAKVHAAYPICSITNAAPFVLEDREEIINFMSEYSMWLAATTKDLTMRKNPQLAVIIHVSYWLNNLRDEQMTERWTQAVDGLEEHVSQWRTVLNSSD